MADILYVAEEFFEKAILRQLPIKFLLARKSTCRKITEYVQKQFFNLKSIFWLFKNPAKWTLNFRWLWLTLINKYNSQNFRILLTTSYDQRINMYEICCYAVRMYKICIRIHLAWLFEKLKGVFETQKLLLTYLPSFIDFFFLLEKFLKKASPMWHPLKVLSE